MTQHPGVVLFGSEDGRPPPYRLAALLRGHANDVRAVASSSSSSQLFTASRDGSARSWCRGAEDGEQGGGWKEERVWQDGHEGYLNALSFVPPTLGDPDKHGFLATAGADSLIQLFSLAPDAPPHPLHTLLGHAHNVCALHCSADACADSRIRLFSGTNVNLVFKGHQGPVRALAKLLPSDPSCALFASASNDGTIRVWNYQSGDALTILGTHDSFIYSLATVPSSAGGGLASSGEDGIISVWNEEDGEKDQEVLVPALSVWSLATLPNGDLACGCSDNMVWVFTRDPLRVADEATWREYNARLAQLQAKEAPRQAAQPVVHGTAALEEPGSKEGEVKLVKQGETVLAHQQWRGTKWEELGEVVDSLEAAAAAAPPAGPREKMQHDGKEYDYVFRIDVKDDEPPLPLPFNLSDDPHAVAAAFIAEHALPESCLEQIVQFKVGLAVRARPPPLHGLLEMRYSSLWWPPRLSNSRSRSLPLEISCVTSAPSLACTQVPLLSAAMAHIHDSHNTASFGRASPLTSLLGNPPSGPSVFRRESSDSSCTSSGSTAPSSVDLTHCALSDEWASLENHTNAQRQQADVALAAWQVRCQTLEEEVARLGVALDKMEKERDEARAECAGCRERGMVDEKVQTASTAVPRLLSPTTRIRSSLARPRPLVNPDLPMSKQAVPPCNAHYLKGFCDVPRCRYEHRYELTPDQVEEMRRGAKHHVCNAIKHGLQCPDGEDCIFGHFCPRGPSCGRERCGFTPEQHLVVLSQLGALRH
ncbi:phospholipase A-2-activating protein [Rhodotorula diobovata]|uniref:Phospholipase A-2-activating protein n=1 Tax=Rhodotorula diobovata TaxID=5288 RepID=A0A5C5FU34_9BASI|nr:phospholipase A-2-activating protein [Rhodotorula diobovata]